MNNILSRDINTPFQIDLGIVEFKDYNLDELLGKAFENNSDYLVSLIDLRKSVYDLKIARSTIFPTITLGTSYGYNKLNQNLDLKMKDYNAALSARISLSWNIFDGKKKSIQRKNAKINIENSKYKIEEQKLNIKRDISNAFSTYENNLKVLSVERSNLKSAEMNFYQSKEYYALGQISSTRFREAQLNLVSAKNNISAALYTAKIAEMDLNRLCGLIVQLQ
jgi:outer membrane protein